MRLIVIIPVVFILVSLSVGLIAMALTQFFLRPPPPSSKAILVLRLWIIGFSLMAGFLGALLAHAITKPVRKAIAEAQEMIGLVELEPPSIRASDEVQALSTLFDRAFVSFVELVQARQMLDGIHEGILALDREGKIAGMNLRAQEMLGFTLNEAARKTLKELVGANPQNRTLLAAIDNALSDNRERAHNRVPFRSGPGKPMLLSLRISPLRLKNEPKEIVGAVVVFKEQPDLGLETPEMVGKSPQFAEVLELAAKVAPTDSRVLILGETGTGKELIANAIHRLSARKDKPFVTVNCAAIPEGLLESELFGHEKGAFTGAVGRKAGKFELADGGTLFLDEIGEMSASLQAKVLRALQEGEFRAVGGSETKKADVRIIAATNKDLHREVEEGRFREDLFYRLNVIVLNVPPLRERKADIPFLADHFLEKLAQRNNQERKSLSRSAMHCLLAYSWPGNVRELENALERAALLASGPVIEPEDLPVAVMSADGEAAKAARPRYESSSPAHARGATLNETLEAVEKELILRALKKCGGVQVEAAKLLGLNHKNLWHKIRKHKISAEDLKDV